ncbi:hypothetical protein KTF56_03520 [Burkholderia gladioli]|uniref:hypothetical protein n=1 Tax=Burkholderia gladioli TaxID=28095 RepID=UPI001C21948B|nr:hypothetical protein [Burkholderia gladioli]MBU9681934.1 hypothetical protein [Burkholderia gladioli]
MKPFWKSCYATHPWNIARTAGPALQRQLAFTLPTRMGLTTMNPDALATMPERVLAALSWRTDGSPEIAALISLIRTNPQRSPEEAVRSVDRTEGVTAPTDEERRITRDRQALDRPRATLEAVIRVGEKVDGLADQFKQIRQEQLGRKRGFFGWRHLATFGRSHLLRHRMPYALAAPTYHCLQLRRSAGAGAVKCAQTTGSIAP